MKKIIRVVAYVSISLIISSNGIGITNGAYWLVMGMLVIIAMTFEQPI